MSTLSAGPTQESEGFNPRQHSQFEKSTLYVVYEFSDDTLHQLWGVRCIQALVGKTTHCAKDGVSEV
jgi:hypothetical protein